MSNDTLNSVQENGDRKYWYIFSIADVIFITILVAILSDGAKLISDMIIGVHIRVGEYIIDNFAIPTHDIFSNAVPPIPWTPPQWLAELIFGALHKTVGLTGLVVFAAFLIAATYAMLFKFLRSSGISIIISILITLLAAGASAVHWLARPHIFSILFLLIWYMILESYQYRNRNYLYALPLMMILWVNIHGGFASGFILLAVYIAGNFIKARFAKEEGQDFSHRAKALIFITLLCLLATMANPQGFRIILSPFQVIANQAAINSIQEWMSPDFHGIVIYEYMLLLTILVLGLSMKRLNIIEISLALLFTHISLYSARFIPLFAIIISPILGKQMDHIIRECRGHTFFAGIISTSENMAAADSRTKWNLWSVTALCAVIILCFAGYIRYQFDDKNMPVDAVQFLKNEHIEGKMFNSDVFGSYIIYAAYPQYEVFYDGREIAGKERREDYLKVAYLKSGWRDVFNKYDISWVIFNSQGTLSNILINSDDWRLIYSDKVADIFVKNISENQKIIDKYPNVTPETIDKTSEE